jgi:quinolinate synthase
MTTIALTGRAALIEEILALKAERGAAILAHNYQIPEIQDLADVVADSLKLAREATAIEGELIVLCGVNFMAETAVIANPGRKVLIPDRGAGCSLADTIQARDIRRWREKHPDGIVVAYVNTSAAVKAEADYCCTSANAVAVVRSLPADKPVMFLPDFFLGSYVQEVTGRRLDIWLGECHVHAALGPDAVDARRRELPQAEVLIHPECGCVTSTLYYMNHEHSLNGNTRICSTEQMMERARVSPARQFVVATETGVLHRMRKENPDKAFYAVADDAECRYMKMITLEKLRDSLRDLKYEVTVPAETAARARLAIERMLAIA